MGSLSTARRIIISTAVILGAQVMVFSSEGTALFIDGKFRTRDLPLEGSRVVVERNDIQVGLITDDVGRIQLRLDLQQVYVLSFEREGCLTKQLLFDTHVPANDLAAAPFFFPFLVILEKRQMDMNLHYAGPVGYVRYFPDKQDFDYDTNYALGRDRMRRKDRTTQMSHYTAVGSEGKWPNTDAASSGEFSVAGHSFSQNDDSHIFHAGAQSGLPAFDVPARGGKNGAQVQPKQLILIGGGPDQQASTDQDVTQHPTIDTEGHVATIPDGRSELILVEKTRVTLVVRVTEQGRTKEYRRVSHRYGDIHCFCDGVSCGEAAYNAGIDVEE